MITRLILIGQEPMTDSQVEAKRGACLPTEGTGICAMPKDLESHV